MRVAALAGVCLFALAVAATPNLAQPRPAVIAYGHRGADDRFRIWLTAAASFVRGRQLLLGREAAFSPRWSSDGRRLLYARPSGIYAAEVARTSGDVIRNRRISTALTEWGLDWSPDGTTVIFAREVGRQLCTDIYTMRADGKRLRRLTTSVACEQHPAWSPDGLRIAFEEENDETTLIAVAGASHGQNRQVLGEGTFPAWSPDGRSLAFLTDEAILVVDSGSGAVQGTVKPDLEYDRLENGLAWSPDGTRLVHGFHDLQETFPLTHLAIIDVDGTDSFRLTPQDTFPDMEPDWQPLCSIYGTDGDDVLTGTPGDDLICGLRGDDRIRAGAGNDTILGGDGNDSIHGQAGSDRLFGAAGNDRVYARDGLPDVANGGPGRDRFWGDQVDTVSEMEDRRG